jgi:hypothetical protein
MISKKVSMKTPEKSRFGKLVSYLVNDQGKHTRVGEVTIVDIGLGRSGTPNATALAIYRSIGCGSPPTPASSSSAACASSITRICC